MTVPHEIENEIRILLYGEHLPVGTVAAQLGVHVDVVRRVAGLLPPRPKPAPRPRLVDPVRAIIEELLQRYPRLRATRLFDMVRPRGYHGSVRTLREHVRGVRPRPSREAFLRLSMLPGEQGQVDWMHAGRIAVPGGFRDLWLFVMVLAWSRATWAEFVIDISAWSLLRSLQRACTYFGGTPREWLFDNPKIVVLERHGGAVRFHPLLVELSGWYAVRLGLCGVRKPHEKGRVERTNRYLRDRFLAARAIHSVDQGNRELLAFFDEVALPRPHPTLPGRTVRDCLGEERGRLLPLPRTPPCTDQIIPVSVDKTAFCRFDRNSYSVPPEHAARTLTLVADDTSVRLLDGMTEVACHPRSFGRQQLIEAKEHREALLAHKGIAQEPKGRDRLRAQVRGIDALYERWVGVGRNLGSMTARTLTLLDRYGPELLADAVADILARGMHDPGAIASFCEQRRRAVNAPAPIDIPLPAHVRDRDVIPHNLESYDEAPRKKP
jgi:transposase